MLTLIASLTAMMFAIAPVYAEATLWAPTIIDTTKVPSSTLVVPINVSDVNKLWGWEFKLKFDPSVLQAVKVYDRNGDLIPDSAVTPLPPFDWESDGVAWGTPVCDNVNGIVGDAYSMLMGEKYGWNATAATPIATVTFNVIGTGGSYLDLFDDVLTDIPEIIPHYTVDGYFANVIPERLADLTKRKAWPEYYSWSVHVHGSINLYAQVKNLGTAAVKVQAWWTVTKDLNRLDFASGIYALSSGEIAVLRCEPSIKPELFDFNGDGVPDYGTYYVTGKVLYDVDGDGILGPVPPDAWGLTTKSFKFTLKP